MVTDTKSCVHAENSATQRGWQHAEERRQLDGRLVVGLLVPFRRAMLLIDCRALYYKIANNVLPEVVPGIELAHPPFTLRPT